MLSMHKVDESRAFLECGDDEFEEIAAMHKALSYYVHNYRFMPKFKSGEWDGRISLLDLGTRMFPIGLAKHVYDCAKEQGIECRIDQEVARCFYDKTFSDVDFDDFLEGTRFFSKGREIFPRDDQIEATKRALKMKRCINLCPTSFGKSLSIAIECLYLVRRGLKCLIVVPTKGLVDQFANDIRDYATNEDGNLEPWYPKIQTVYGGLSKDILDETQICISTWQSLDRIWKTDRKVMNLFDCICLDECFDEDSPVLMADGTLKRIKDVVSGDKILNWSEQRQEFKEDVVEAVHRNLISSMSEKMYQLTFDNGRVIKCTGNHKFLTKNGWKRADELNNEDDLIMYEEKKE